MADSDSDYDAGDLSADEEIAQSSSAHGTRSTGPVPGAAGSSTKGGDTNGGTSRQQRAAWEDIQRSWDSVIEGADGTINSTVEGLREANKRKRCELSSSWPCKADFVPQIIERYNTITTRHYSTSPSYPRSVFCHG